MPKLYIEEYTRHLADRRVFIACREGILRDHFHAIIGDIKFLVRQGIKTTLFHNMSNRFANQQHFRELAQRLPQTIIIRIPSDEDFYTQVLDRCRSLFKLILLERKFLIDLKGYKINTLTTQGARRNFGEISRRIANANLQSVLTRICHKIEEGHCDRVHILPAGKNTIKCELFTIEGSGTMIANNFIESFQPVGDQKEATMVAGILSLYRGQKYLKPRSKKYIQKNWNNFFVTRIDGIIVGCVEMIEIDPDTAELGALAISTKFRNQRVGLFTINAFIEEMRRRGFTRYISLTNNPKLATLYKAIGFEPVSESIRGRYNKRQAASPDVAMFYKAIR
jgi:N-acetylglutamate synthase-like GNAT family acetyltransferase